MADRFFFSIACFVRRTASGRMRVGSFESVWKFMGMKASLTFSASTFV